MIRALAETGPDTPVLEVMDRNAVTFNCRAPLANAVAALQTNGMRLIVIVDDDDRVVGMVTLEHFAEYMMIGELGRAWRPVKCVLDK